ncbi:hypothetical protein P692DRAFT_201840867 [Suillus brevipes Sb2]|nr:hypothetical protein P692DRAFT_201840867 [Suillus brevipes Sb2]
MIALCRSKSWVIHLKEEHQNLHLPHSQRGVKGHVIVYPQEASAVAKVLPPSMEEITTPICVLFSLNVSEDEQILPVHVQHVKPNYGEEMLTSRYDTISEDMGAHPPEVDFQNVVVADVDVHAPANELSAAALRHVKNHGGGYIQIPHDASHSVRMSIKRHVRHLFSLQDR